MGSIVLIVEDHPLHAKLFSEAFRSQGYRAITARTGAETMAAVAGVWPQAVLIDIMLPDRDGRDVIADLRARPGSAALAIVAISAASDRLLPEQCRAAGADAFFAKPVRLVDLFGRMAQLIGPACGAPAADGPTPGGGLLPAHDDGAAEPLPPGGC